MELLDLPQVCLEEVFKNLSFSELSKLGGVCRYFRNIGQSIFRRYFKNQEQIVQKEMDKIVREANGSKQLTIEDHLHLALLLSMLRILLSEAKMLKAHCWRYVKDPKYDFCFPAGVLLDEFHKILDTIRDKKLNKCIEPEITTKLFHMGETFYDYFDTRIEMLFKPPYPVQVKIASETKRKTFLPNSHSSDRNSADKTLLRKLNQYMKGGMIYEDDPYYDNGPNSRRIAQQKEDTYSDDTGECERVLFGVKVLDILDCCAASDFQSLLSKNIESDWFQIVGEYELQDVNVLEPLPATLSYGTSERQLQQICQYIRNNVRWTNLFHPLQDLWMLEDAIKIKKDIRTASSLLREWKAQQSLSRFKTWQKDEELYLYDHRKNINGFKNRFGLLVTVKLECPKCDNEPIKTENSDLSAEKKVDNDNLLYNENILEEIKKNLMDNHFLENCKMKELHGNTNKYKFHLELKIQYPSCLAHTVQEVILKVDQEGEGYINT